METVTDHKLETILLKMVAEEEQYGHQKLNYNQRQEFFSKINVTVVACEMRNRRQCAKHSETIEFHFCCCQSETAQSNITPAKLPVNCTFKFLPRSKGQHSSLMILCASFRRKIAVVFLCNQGRKQATPEGIMRSSQLHTLCKKVVLLNVLSIHVVQAYSLSPRPESISSSVTVVPWVICHPTSPTHSATHIH